MLLLIKITVCSEREVDCAFVTICFLVWQDENGSCFYLKKRERELKAQLLRPSLQATLKNKPISYITFTDLKCDYGGIFKFGANINCLHKISKTATC